MPKKKSAICKVENPRSCALSEIVHKGMSYWSNCQNR